VPQVGDASTPGTIEIEYPSLLGQPAAHLRAYPPETVVAEKFQAMVALGMLNTRLKEFHDIWAIAGSFAYDDAVLSRAIQLNPIFVTPCDCRVIIFFAMGR